MKRKIILFLRLSPPYCDLRREEMCDFHLPVPLRSSPNSSLARPVEKENHLVLISASLIPFPVTSEEKEDNCDFYMAPFLSPFISLLLFSSSDQKGKWSFPDFRVPHSLASSPSVKKNQRASFIFRILSFASFQPPFSFLSDPFFLIFVQRFFLQLLKLSLFFFSSVILSLHLRSALYPVIQRFFL